MILRLRRSPKRFNNFILFHIGAVCLRTYRQSTITSIPIGNIPISSATGTSSHSRPDTAIAGIPTDGIAELCQYIYKRTFGKVNSYPRTGYCDRTPADRCRNDLFRQKAK